MVERETYSVRHRRRSLELQAQRALSTPARVYRDPCPRCAVRADVGCAHSGLPLVGVRFG